MAHIIRLIDRFSAFWYVGNDSFYIPIVEPRGRQSDDDTKGGCPKVLDEKGTFGHGRCLEGLRAWH